MTIIIIINKLNYLLNSGVFNHILRVNHNDHKVIFLFNLGHVMFRDTDGHETSNTAARMF